MDWLVDLPARAEFAAQNQNQKLLSETLEDLKLRLFESPPSASNPGSMSSEFRCLSRCLRALLHAQDQLESVQTICQVWQGIVLQSARHAGTWALDFYVEALEAASGESYLVSESLVHVLRCMNRILEDKAAYFRQENQWNQKEQYKLYLQAWIQWIHGNVLADTCGSLRKNDTLWLLLLQSLGLWVELVGRDLEYFMECRGYECIVDLLTVCHQQQLKLTSSDLCCNTNWEFTCGQGEEVMELGLWLLREYVMESMLKWNENQLLQVSPVPFLIKLLTLDSHQLKSDLDFGLSSVDSAIDLGEESTESIGAAHPQALGDESASGTCPLNNRVHGSTDDSSKESVHGSYSLTIRVLNSITSIFEHFLSQEGYEPALQKLRTELLDLGFLNICRSFLNETQSLDLVRSALQAVVAFLCQHTTAKRQLMEELEADAFLSIWFQQTGPESVIHERLFWEFIFELVLESQNGLWPAISRVLDTVAVTGTSHGEEGMLHDDSALAGSVDSQSAEQGAGLSDLLPFPSSSHVHMNQIGADETNHWIQDIKHPQLFDVKASLARLKAPDMEGRAGVTTVESAFQSPALSPSRSVCDAPPKHLDVAWFLGPAVAPLAPPPIQSFPRGRHRPSRSLGTNDRPPPWLSRYSNPQDRSPTNLSPPLPLTAVQRNMSAGYFPPGSHPSSMNQRFLSVPSNRSDRHASARHSPKTLSSCEESGADGKQAYLIGYRFVDDVAAELFLHYMFRLFACNSSSLLPVCRIFVALLSGNPLIQKQLEHLDAFKEFLRIYSDPQFISQNFELLEDILTVLGRFSISSAHMSTLLRMINVATDELQFECPLDASHQLALRGGALRLLLSITAREDPSTFFYFNGNGYVESSIFKRFPCPQEGYTLSCWVRPFSFVKKETGFITIQEKSGNSKLELFFRRIPRKQSESCIRRQQHRKAVDDCLPVDDVFLCIRTDQNPFAAEDFVFDAFNFEPDSKLATWRHVALSYSDAGISLFIDGNLVQSCSTFSYPKSGAEYSIILGRRALPLIVEESESLRDNTSLKSVKMETNALERFFSRLWSGELFNYATNRPLSSLDRRCTPSPAKNDTENNSKPPENQDFIGVIGACYLLNQSLDSSGLAKIVQYGPAVLNPFSQKELTDSVSVVHSINPEDFGTNISENRPSMYHGCGLINTSTPDKAWSDIAFYLPRLLFLGRQNVQPDGILILTHLLTRNTALLEQFERLNGWAILYSALCQAEVLDERLVNSLLRLSSEEFIRSNSRIKIFLALQTALIKPLGMAKINYRRAACLELLFDVLLQNCRSEYIVPTVQNLIDCTLASQNNFSVWNQVLGVDWCLEWLLDAPECTHEPVLQMVQHLLEFYCCSNEALVTSSNPVPQLVQFVSYCGDKSSQVKLRILSILVANSNSPSFLQALKSIDIVAALIGWLSCAEPAAQYMILQLMCSVCHTYPEYVAVQLTQNGMMHTLYECFVKTSVLDRSIFQYLLDMCVARKSDSEKSASHISLPRAYSRQRLSQTEISEPLVIPDLLQIVMKLLVVVITKRKFDVACEALYEIRRLMSAHNVAAIWNSHLSWVSWFEQIVGHLRLSEKTVSPDEERIQNHTLSIVQKLLFYDLQQIHSKAAEWLGLYSSNSTCQQQLLNSLLNYIESHPKLKDETAPSTLQNLILVHQSTNQQRGYRNLDCDRHLLSCLHRISCYNSGIVRNIMEKMGLFSLRDTLLVDIVRDVATNPSQSYIIWDQLIRSVPIEIVAERPLFCQNGGIEALVSLFLDPDFKDSVQVGLKLASGCFLESLENQAIILQCLNGSLSIFDPMCCALRSEIQDLEGNVRQFLTFFHMQVPESERNAIRVSLKESISARPRTNTTLSTVSHPPPSPRQHRSADRKNSFQKSMESHLIDIRTLIAQRQCQLSAEYQCRLEAARVRREERRRLGDQSMLALIEKKQ